MSKRTNLVRLRPTDAELEILRVLWQHRQATVRQVHATLNAGRTDGPGYTTVLKLMQIMTTKGLVDRDESQRPQMYTSRYGQSDTQRQLVRDLLRRAFGGSHRQLVLQVLADQKASADELREIEALLKRFEEDKP